MTSKLGLWEPLSIDAVGRLLQSGTVPWWIAGGWAIDLHLGRRSRAHADVDVLVLRPHLQDLRCCLAGGTCTPPTGRAHWCPGRRIRACHLAYTTCGVDLRDSTPGSCS